MMPEYEYMIYQSELQERSTFYFVLFRFTTPSPILLLCHLIHFFLVFYVLAFIFFLLPSYFLHPPMLSLLLVSSALPTAFSCFHFPSLLLPLSFFFSSPYSLGLRITHIIFMYTSTLLSYTAIT